MPYGFSGMSYATELEHPPSEAPKSIKLESKGFKVGGEIIYSPLDESEDGTSTIEIIYNNETVPILDGNSMVIIQLIYVDPEQTEGGTRNHEVVI